MRRIAWAWFLFVPLLAGCCSQRPAPSRDALGACYGGSVPNVEAGEGPAYPAPGWSAYYARPCGYPATHQRWIGWTDGFRMIAR